MSVKGVYKRMSQPIQCIFCKYKKRNELESKLLLGEISMSEAGRIIGASYQSVSRHMKNHVPKETTELSNSIKANIEETSIGSIINAEKTLSDIIKKANQVLKEAEEVKNYDLMLKAMDQTRKSLETAGKLFAEIIKPREDNSIKIEIEFI